MEKGRMGGGREGRGGEAAGGGTGEEGERERGMEGERYRQRTEREKKTSGRIRKNFGQCIRGTL